MTTFVDTTILLAVLDSDADEHRAAVDAFTTRGEGEHLVTTNYVTVEAMSVAHRRIGTVAVRTMREVLLAPVEVRFVDRGLHLEAETSYIRSIRRRSSLVDHVSFEFMRRRGITTALALDKDFARAGFEVVP